MTFVMAGDPDHETSLAIVKALPQAGADLIELGMPFTDPMADGPAIQAAELRALAAGQNMKRTLALVRDFRRGDDATPIVLMGYYNPIYVYGVERFLADAKSAGVDGLIVVDLPPEEDEELCLPALHAGFNFIRLATPTTDDKRLPAVLKNTSGFVYYVSITGITGSAAPDSAKVAAAVKRIKQHTKLPVCVGFGVRAAAQARAIAAVADGVVVGSALVEAIRKSLGPDGKATPATVRSVTDLVRELAEGVRSARTRSLGTVRCAGFHASSGVEFRPSTPHISSDWRDTMARDVARDWMWSEAIDMLARAERMHRELFRPGATQARQPVWEPPVDILETEYEVLVLVALPGVDAEQAQAAIEDGELVITGVRTYPPALRTAVIHRLEQRRDGHCRGPGRCALRPRPFPCRNICAMPITRAPSGSATARDMNTRTRARGISWRRTTWAWIKSFTSPRNRVWKRK